MCWRQLSKLQKTVSVLAFYLILYLTLDYAFYPYTGKLFVREELRVGNHFAFIYLVRSPPVMSDAEGAGVFDSRKCGGCFITNNKSFLPVGEYDAIVFDGGEKTLYQLQATFRTDPAKMFRLHAEPSCLAAKLRGCSAEPVVFAFETRENLDLCGLCRRLTERRKHKPLL